MLYIIVSLSMFGICMILFLLNMAGYNIQKADKHLFIVFSVFIFAMAAFRVNSGFDYTSYESIFNSIKSGDYSRLLSFTELFYILLNILFSSFRLVLFASAVLGVILKEIYYYKQSSFRLLCLAMYFSSVFLTYDMGIVRQGIAISVTMYGIKYIKERNFKKFIFNTFVASMFHVTALIMIPLYFLGERKLKRWIYYSVPVVCYFASFFSVRIILKISSILNISLIQYRLNLYASEYAVDVNILTLIRRLVMLILFVETYIYYSRKKIEISQYSTIYINGFFLSAVGALLFSGIKIFTSRGLACLYFMQIPLIAEMASIKKEKIISLLAFILSAAMFINTVFQLVNNSSGNAYETYSSIFF